MNRQVKLRVRNLHTHVTCFLCDGYFVDATAITECLHSFCRTCIVRHLSEHKYCPICRVQVHKTRPLLNIRHDQTLQDIVYALVPGLRQNEMKRRKQFWSDTTDLVTNKTFTPEELGVTDNQNTWRDIQKKICLSIEPAKPIKEKLSSKSEWDDVTPPIRKRYIRCCQDVTILHLHKFIRMKFGEDDSHEVIMFLGENVLPQNFSLLDVIETFPQSVGQTMELTFDIYSPKSLKRKIALDDVSNNLVVPVTKKPRLPSATPQLKAFFNSQITTQNLKQSVPQKVVQSHDFGDSVTVGVKKDDDADSQQLEKQKLFESIKLKTVDSSTKSQQDLKSDLEDSVIKTGNDSKNVSSNSATEPATNDAIVDVDKNLSTIDNVTANNDTEKTRDVKKIEQLNDENLPDNEIETEESKTVVPAMSAPVAAAKEKIDKFLIPGSNGDNLSVQPKISTSETLKKPADNLKCYTLLDIPVDEAVRSKPPTPVEIPAHVYPKKPKYAPEFNHLTTQSKVVGESADPKFPRNRRKPTNPIHHVQDNIPTVEASRPPPIDPKPLQPKIPDTLTQEHLQSKYGHISTPHQSGQFILLSTHSSNPGPARTARPIQPRPETHKQKTSQQLHYEKLSNAQAHRVALDAVRSTMSKVLLQPEKRPTPKRPILPKVNNNISQMVINPLQGNVPSTRNIFQNDKPIYPMNRIAPPPVARPQPPSKKESVSVFPRKIKPNSSSRKSDIEHLKQLRNQQLLLTQMAAAVAKSQAAKKEHSMRNSPSSSRSGPPPPYQASSRNHHSSEVSAVSSSRSNPKPFISRTSSSSSGLSNLMPKSQLSPALRQTITQPHTTLRRPSYQGSPNNSSLSSAPSRSATANLPSPRNLNIPLQQAQRPTPSPVAQFKATSIPDHMRTFGNNQPFVRNTLAKTSRSFQSPPLQSTSPIRQQTLTRPSLYNQTLVQTLATSQNPPYFVNSNPKSTYNFPANHMHARSATPNPIPSRNSLSKHILASNMALSSPPSRSVGNHPNTSWNQTPNTTVPRQRPPNQPQNTGFISKSNIPGNAQQSKWSDKRKPNILRKSPAKNTFSISTPPAGTKSPWATREFPLPVAPQSVEYTLPQKRQNTLSPPAAHQHSFVLHQSNQRPPLNTLTPPLSDTSDVPLELTSKSTRSLQPFITTSQATSSYSDAEQPLCLIVKKK